MNWDYRTDAEWEEQIRASALGLEPPSYEQWCDWVDMQRKREKEGSLSEPGGSPKNASISVPATSSPGSESASLSEPDQGDEASPGREKVPQDARIGRPVSPPSSGSESVEGHWKR